MTKQTLGFQTPCEEVFGPQRPTQKTKPQQVSGRLAKTNASSNLGGGFNFFFDVQPLLGEMISFDILYIYDMFQMGDPTTNCRNRRYL